MTTLRTSYKPKSADFVGSQCHVEMQKRPKAYTERATGFAISLSSYSIKFYKTSNQQKWDLLSLVTFYRNLGPW